MWRAGLLVVDDVFLGGVVIAAYTTISQPQPGTNNRRISARHRHQQASPNKGTGNQAVPTRQSQPGHQQPGNQPTRAPNPGKNAKSFVVSCVMMGGWGFGISSGSRVQACAGYINPLPIHYSLVCKSPPYILLPSLNITHQLIPPHSLLLICTSLGSLLLMCYNNSCCICVGVICGGLCLVL
jgi:hypothetical protein